MVVWVAYNFFGDLIAEADSEGELYFALGDRDDIALIGTVTP